MSSLRKEHTVEERLELSLLYDFYGALLKENQQRMFEASILEDYNFSEIAQDEGITRQGVYDTIKRATKQLEMYEKKLGLVARFREQKKKVEELRDKLGNMEIPASNVGWEEVFQILEEMLEG